MIERINEEMVIQAAREWAARSNKSDASTASNALEAISTIREKLNDQEYRLALEKLYWEYIRS